MEEEHLGNDEIIEVEEEEGVRVPKPFVVALAMVLALLAYAAMYLFVYHDVGKILSKVNELAPMPERHLTRSFYVEHKISKDRYSSVGEWFTDMDSAKAYIKANSENSEWRVTPYWKEEDSVATIFAYGGEIHEEYYLNILSSSSVNAATKSKPVRNVYIPGPCDMDSQGNQICLHGAAEPPRYGFKYSAMQSPVCNSDSQDLRLENNIALKQHECYQEGELLWEVKK